MFRFFFILILAPLVTAWSDAFTEQYQVFGSPVCVKHYNRAYTSYGLNYRLDRDGDYIYKDDGGEPIKRRVNGPARSLLECAKLCQDNSKCVAFAHRSRDNLCQFMAHCELTHDSSHDFRYFTKKAFGCHQLNHFTGQTCNGTDVMQFTSPMLVEECLEKAYETHAMAFTMTADMHCKLWHSCEDTIFEKNVTLYYT